MACWDVMWERSALHKHATLTRVKVLHHDAAVVNILTRHGGIKDLIPTGQDLRPAVTYLAARCVHCSQRFATSSRCRNFLETSTASGCDDDRVRDFPTRTADAGHCT